MDQIALYLAPFENLRGLLEKPIELTQSSIAAYLGRKGSGVSRSMARLRNKGLVEFQQARVSEKRRTQQVHFLSTQGFQRYEEVVQEVGAVEVDFEDVSITLDDLADREDLTLLDMVLKLQGRDPAVEEPLPAETGVEAIGDLSLEPCEGRNSESRDFLGTSVQITRRFSRIYWICRFEKEGPFGIRIILRRGEKTT